VEAYNEQAAKAADRVHTIVADMALVTQGLRSGWRVWKTLMRLLENPNYLKSMSIS